MEALQRLHNRGSISTGYDIDNSVKLEADNNEHLSRVMVAGNRKTWTYSTWFKRTELGFTNVLIHFGVNHQATRMMLNNDDTLYVDMCDTGTALYRSITNRVFRDTSAFYHVVLRVDTTQSTEADRMKVYINGVEETSWAQHQIPPQNLETLANTTAAGYDDMGIGTYVWAGSNYDGLFSGYIAQVAHVDGQSYAPTEFGEFDDDSGIWKPKDVSGLTYGTGNNSFFLDFEIASDLGANAKGNDVNFSLSNLSAADQATDTPTNNFCTLNPLDNNWANVPIINEGATNHHSDSANFEGSSGTIAMSSGKWYWEIKTMHSDGNIYMLGIGSTQYGEVPGSQSPHDVLNFAGLYLANSGTEGGLFVTDSTGGSVYRNAFNPGANYSANDIYGFALDLDSSPQTITFYRNGTNINPSSGAPLDIAGACSILPVTVRLSIHEREAQCNFGGYTEFSISSAASDANGYGTFEYAPPSGYYALCTKNLEEYG